MSKLSVCIIAKDEEANIARALESVASVADELIVVDTGSSDNTIEVAEAAGARVVEHKWQHDFSEARNFASGLANNGWVFHLDAAEELDAPDQSLMTKLLTAPNVDAYWCQLINLAKPTSFSGAVGSRSIRLFRRSKYRYSGIIHEQASLSTGGGASLEQRSELRIIHWGYADQTKVATRVARNTDLLKRALANDPTNYMLQYYLGTALMKSKHYSESIDELKSAQSLLPNGATEHQALFLLSLCEALEGAGRLDEALDYGELATRKFPDYRDLIYLVGELNLKADRIGRAVELFQRCTRMPTVPGRYLFARQGLDKMAGRKLRRLSRNERTAGPPG